MNCLRQTESPKHLSGLTRDSVLWQYARVVCVITCLISTTASAVADTLGGAARTSDFYVKSAVLGETRQVYVRTPPGFDPGKNYPVVYVLDGEWNFEFVASYLDYFFDNDIYPDLIVTGITNVNRNRDYVPRADPRHHHTGNAPAFLEFVESEWIPAVASRYPVNQHRILVGHSFGGVFTLHALFNRPAVFDAYIALGSSAWIGDNVLLEEAEAFFAKEKSADAFVYMAVGEGDGGPTVPSGKKLAALFEQMAPASLEWSFSVTPKTDHFKNFVSGLHDGFMALFPAWGFSEELKAAARQSGAEGVNAWFAEKESTLGYRFRPAWFDLGVAGVQLSREAGGTDAALAVMENLTRYLDAQPLLESFSATVYLAAGKPDLAEAAVRRAIAIARDEGLHPNAVQIESLEAQLVTIESARDAYTDPGE